MHVSFLILLQVFSFIPQFHALPRVTNTPSLWVEIVNITLFKTVADIRGGRRGAQASIIFTKVLVLKSGSTRKFLF